MNSDLGFIALARKAGKLVCGDDRCAETAAAGRARLVLSAADASERTLKRAREYSTRLKIPMVGTPFTREELGEALGSGETAVAVVTDRSFAEEIRRRFGDGKANTQV